MKITRSYCKEVIGNGNHHIRWPTRISVPNLSGEAGVLQTLPTDTLI
jgi:hypothetical protein